MERNHKTGRASRLLLELSQPIQLTQGSPWKVILRYAAPIMLSYLLQQIYVLTDAIICGQVLPTEQVAGVNDTFALTLFFLQFAFGCTAGFGVITARYIGGGDKVGARRSFATQIYLTLAISLLLTVLALSLLPTLLGLINVHPENPVVYGAARDYCFYLFLGIAAQMGYNFVCGILRSYGDSVTPLVFLVISTALNIGLDLLFLIPLAMGPAGAAIATVTAQLLSMIGCLVYTFHHYPDLRLGREDFRIGKRDVFMHLRQGIPLGLQFAILSVGIIVMQGAVVRFDLTESGRMVVGTPAQNGFGAANKLISFLMAMYNGLASGILGYNAQNLGKQDYERIRKGTLQSLVLMLILFGLCLTVGLLLSVGGAYQYIFMSREKISDATIRFGNTFLYVDILLYGVLGFLIVVRSAVQGIGKSAYVLGAGIAELLARGLICAYLPAIINGGPIDSTASGAAFAAVCFGDPGAWIAASLVLLFPLCRNILGMRYEKERKSMS